MKKRKLYVVYTCTHRKLDPSLCYQTNGDMYFLKDLTNNELVRIPWENPTQRDLSAFIKGYCFGKGQVIEFENVIEEW